MKENESIKKIFGLYISGKPFSRKGQVLFGKWLRASHSHEEKEKQLYHYWETVDGKITDDTWNDWNCLQSKLKKPSDRFIGQMNRNWLKYAAAVVLLIVSVSTTYWMTLLHTLKQPVEMVELYVENGETREILLPDSSRMWVNSGTTVIYPTDFRNMSSRTVYLSGEASFKVYKDKEKPFIVNTSSVNVEALGTVFTVKSYSGEEYTTATLEEGSIQVSLKENLNESYILKPSEQLIYSRSDKNIQLTTVDLSSYKLIRKGYIIFENVSFKELVSSLEKKYNVKFQYNATKYENDLYCVKFSPDETIEEVMNILNKLIGIKYTIIDNVIVVN